MSATKVVAGAGVGHCFINLKRNENILADAFMSQIDSEVEEYLKKAFTPQQVVDATIRRFDLDVDSSDDDKGEGDGPEENDESCSRSANSSATPAPLPPPPGLLARARQNIFGKNKMSHSNRSASSGHEQDHIECCGVGGGVGDAVALSLSNPNAEQQQQGQGHGQQVVNVNRRHGQLPLGSKAQLLRKQQEALAPPQQWKQVTMGGGRHQGRAFWVQNCADIDCRLQYFRFTISIPFFADKVFMSF